MLSLRNNFKKTRRIGLGRKKFIYSKKSYANPFFQPKRKVHFRQSDLSIKRKLLITSAFILGLIFIWLIFFSNLFKINKIEVDGVGESTVKEIELIALNLAENKLVGKNNLLLFSKSELSKILNEKYFLQNLKIKKKLWHTLKITLREMQPAAVWYENAKYYYLDSEGKIINQVDPLNISRNGYALIENLTDVKILGRKANINQPVIDFVLNLFKEFKDKKHGFEIEKFIVDKEAKTVKMVVLAGPKIYFNTEEAIARQVEKLDLIIKEKLKDNFKNKEYINLKYGNNIYIK